MNTMLGTELKCRLKVNSFIAVHSKKSAKVLVKSARKLPKAIVCADFYKALRYADKEIHPLSCFKCQRRGLLDIGKTKQIKK